MPKAEISWKRVTPDGRTLQCYARHSGRQWIFRWEQGKNPPAEDWLALLDSVRRRINRRLLRPEEEALLRKIIAERFPDRPR